MEIMVLGADGYIGRALCHYLEDRGMSVVPVDNRIRRELVKQSGSQSVYPIPEYSGINVDVGDAEFEKVFMQTVPDAVIHLAEIPSAPYSMRGVRECIFTQVNNIAATLNVLWYMKKHNPDCHLVKLGTAGEYSDFIYNGMVIPEGSRIKVNYKEYENWEIPTPRYGASYYHFSKLHDSNNIDYACRVWGLRCTDINQGPVYGHLYDTRMDCDETWGTVVNRFVAQAVAGIPMTVYGTGHQVRGYINLQNSLEAVLAIVLNPPRHGEFRVIHQVTEEKSVSEIADYVKAVVTGSTIQYVNNPRVEMEKNNFVFERKFLSDMGLKTIRMEDSILPIVEMVERHKNRIVTETIQPKTLWR